MNDQQGLGESVLTRTGSAQGDAARLKNALPGKALAMLADGPCIGERVLDIADFSWPLPDSLYIRREFNMVKGVTSEQPEIGEYESWERYDKDRDTSWDAGNGAVMVGAVYEHAARSHP